MGRLTTLYLLLRKFLPRDVIREIRYLDYANVKKEVNIDIVTRSNPIFEELVHLHLRIGCILSNEETTYLGLRPRMINISDNRRNDIDYPVKRKYCLIRGFWLYLQNQSNDLPVDDRYQRIIEIFGIDHVREVVKSAPCRKISRWIRGCDGQSRYSYDDVMVFHDLKVCLFCYHHLREKLVIKKRVKIVRKKR